MSCKVINVYDLPYTGGDEKSLSMGHGERSRSSQLVLGIARHRLAASAACEPGQWRPYLPFFMQLQLCQSI